MSTATRNLDVLKQLYSTLSAQEKDLFLTSLSQKEVFDKTLQHRKISHCPHCNSEHFVKNGFKNKSQRYLCRDCRKSFVTHSGTIFFGSPKDLSVWQKYVHCMIEKYTLAKCAKICDISIPTAFYWRHKILNALQNMMNEVELDGVVQADETFVQLSFKGNHKNFHLPRAPHHRGTRASKRGLSKEQVCIPCGVNLDGMSVAKVASLGKPKLKDLEKVLNGKIVADSVFVTDSLRAYSKLSLDMQLNHIRIPRNKRTSGIFNIQTVNSYHSRLKDLIMGRFKGVASKYLNHYLVYHNFVNFAKESTEEKETILFDFVRNVFSEVRIRQISKRRAVPV